MGQAPVAHVCNPSYSGGCDREDCGLKPDWGNSSQDPISKNKQTNKQTKKTHHKKGLVEWFKM
jgi:hypothetical protein